jgi:endonuclease/exonuclease/phosphatase family metal-dependent hydrolase
MAGSQGQTDNTRNKMSKLKTRLKCLQINLQHSRTATANITKIINEEETDIVFIQEPYNVSNKVVGLPRSCAVFTSGTEKKRAAIVVINKRIDTLLITQLSKLDTVVVEAKVDNTSLILVSMYFDFNRAIHIDMQKMQEILTHAKGTGTIFAIDSNARSTTWHDVITNKRGKSLEELLRSRQLYTANEESSYKTFQSGRGASNIDLTILNNQAIEIINDWTIHDYESCSDHILKYELGKAEKLQRYKEICMI